MLYGEGLRDEAVPLRLAHYPPVITCFRCCLETPGRERATAAGEACRHAHAAWRRKQKQHRVLERPWERHAARRRAALLEKALTVERFTFSPPLLSTNVK